MNGSDRNLDVKISADKIKWKFFLRQVLICSGTWACYFVHGLASGAPTVLVPQLRREANSTAAVSEEMASWLPAIFSYNGIPWVFVLPLMMRNMGRRIPQIVVCVLTLLGFIILYCSKNLTHIIISEIVQGALTAAFLTISIVIITEYTSPKYRGIFLTIKSATFFWGILVSNTIGTFFHWKNIALLGTVCSVYSLATIVFLPESPYWLAAKGRIEECSASHRWLKGSDKASERELEKIISSEQCTSRETNKISRETISKLLKIIICKQFYKPILLSILVLNLYTFSGKIVCTIYALDIIKKITSSETTAYKAMLILDAVTVLSMYFGCGLAKLFRRRIILLITSSIGIGFLFSMSLYLYLIKLTLITENKYVSVGLLSGYSISICCGPMIMATSISGELIPLHARSISICIIAVTFKIISGSFIKISPYIFKGFGLYGTFLFYGLSSLICLTLIYFYLPETKDKTLQEISDSIMGRNLTNVYSKELVPLNGREAQISIKPGKNTIEL